MHCGRGYRRSALGRARWTAALALPLACLTVFGQIDPYRRNLLQLGYDQPIEWQGPQAVYAYYYYNNPEIAETNTVLRLAIAPVYVDGELGLRELLSPHTDVGIGLYGGAFGDNYYEVRQGDFRKSESFYGHGGGTALSVYHLINPGMVIPLNAVGRAGFRYSTFLGRSDTANAFELPGDRPMPFVRAGLRLAGQEPLLYPDLSLELSAWVEQQWRLNHGLYGFNDDRRVEARSALFWGHAGIDYSWTNAGHKVSFATTVGSSTDADRLNAWRLGGVLPLIAEFPLILPGYVYQELTAQRFALFRTAYLISLDSEHRFQLRFEAATASIKPLPGFELPDRWQTGVGGGLTYTPKRRHLRLVARYGYGINALREDGHRGGHSLGLLLQYDFERHKERR
jgi:hypothetical protein